MSSLDWLISIGLLPLSFALTGPVSGAIGAQATLIGGGVLGAAVTLAALLLPGMRAVEGRREERPPVRPHATTTLREPPSSGQDQLAVAPRRARRDALTRLNARANAASER